MEIALMSNSGPNNQQFEDLCEALRFKIKAFKRENPNLSGLQIAKIFGMASSTLNRIENRSIRTPSLDQVVKVLRGVGAHGELIEFMDEFYPAISDSFRKHIVYKKDSLPDEHLMKLIFDQANFRVFLLAACGNGVSEEYLKENLGLDGVQRLEKLRTAGVLKSKNNRFVVDEGCPIVFNKLYAKDMLVRTIGDHYKAEKNTDIDTGVAIVSTCSVKDQRTIEEIKRILREAKQSIHRLVDSDESKGDIKYFFTLCCDTIS